MEGLAALYTGPVERDAPLADKTTFRLGGRADWLFTPDDPDQIGPLLAFLHARDLPVTVLGEGSNVLIRDGGVRGAVLRIGRALADLNWDGDLARCGAGLPSARLAREALDAGRGGFVWAASLPGNLGGALRMNAGAFGGELADSYAGCSGWRLDGSPFSLGPDSLDFDYRHSSLPEDAVATRILLRLPELDEAGLAEAREHHAEILARRTASQPGGLWTAGSTFKNPPGDQAGRLIDSCGLKGLTRGGARISERHANFIVAGGDTVRAADVEELIAAVAAVVAERTGVKLEREIRILGVSE